MALNSYIDKVARDIIENYRRKLGPEWKDSDVIRWMAAEIKARAEARVSRSR